VVLDVPPPDHHFPMLRGRVDRFEAALLTQRGESLDGARVIGDGYLSTAYVLADGVTVARVPKFEGAVPDLEFELAVLPVLADARLSVETPRDVRSLRDDHGLVAALHRLVVCTPLKPRIEDLRSTGAWQGHAHDFGRFLTTLHSIPIERFEGLQPDRWWQLADRWVADARPALGERGNAWVDSPGEARGARAAGVRP
jgi:aminoglycoside phosphotransferase (APT) family kinase protein